MSGRTRRWRSAVLALAAAVAFVGGLLALDSTVNFDGDYGWGSAVLNDYGWGAPAFDASSTAVR